MDRKLSNSLIALSAAGLFLAAALLVATPVGSGGPDAPLLDTAAAAVQDEVDEDRRDGGSGAKGVRRGLALPYFSFAHGLRRIGG